MYEKCKSEIPKGVYQSIQKYCITTAFLCMSDMSIKVEDNLINTAQESINYMQEFLSDLANFLKELRKKEETKNETLDNSTT